MKEYKTKIFIFERKENDDKDSLYKIFEVVREVIKKKGYWNSGMFFLRKDSIIKNFKKYQPKTYKSCLSSGTNAKYKNNTQHLVELKKLNGQKTNITKT